jgi:hypothetical protein
MKPFEPKRVVRTATFKLAGPPSKVFPLLCPTREYDWIEGWRCDLVYSQSGVAEDGCVFRTDLPAEPGPELWVVTRYEPVKAIEFVRVTPGVRTVKLDIWLSDNGDSTTLVLWRQTVTGLSDAGNEWVSGYSPEAYQQRITVVETMLNHYLATGEKLTGVVSAHMAKDE